MIRVNFVTTHARGGLWSKLKALYVNEHHPKTLWASLCTHGNQNLPEFVILAEVQRVPELLLSGNDKKIQEWRVRQSILATQKKRRD